MLVGSLLALMAYARLGEEVHEILGTSMLLFMFVHLWHNKTCLANIFHGKSPRARIFHSICALLLILILCLQGISGIVVSKHLFAFMQIPGSAFARAIHLCLAYWCFVLIAIHMGLKATRFIKLLTTYFRERMYLVILIYLSIAFYGFLVFTRSDILDYMLLNKAFMSYNSDEPMIVFFLEHIALGIFFITFGMIINKMSKYLSSK